MILLLIFVFAYQRDTDEKILMKRILKAKSGRGNHQVLEFAQRMIGKSCAIYLLNSQLIGVIREVNDGAVWVEQKDGLTAVNLDFLVRIKEIPQKKRRHGKDS